MSHLSNDLDLDNIMATPTMTPEQVLRQLQEEVAKLRKENGEMQTLINEAHARIDKKKPTKVKLEQPEKFGGDPAKLGGFLIEVANYHEHHDEMFEDEESKTRYAATRLKDEALVWFEPTMEDFLKNEEKDWDALTKKVFSDYDDFAAELTKMFGDGDKKRHAQERLAKLRQTKSAMTYASVFRQNAFRSGINDDGLMQLFYDGLKEEVKDDLYQKDRPKTLDEYIAMAIRIDDRLYSRRQERKGARTYQPGTHNKANDKKKRQPKSTAYGTHPGAMDVDAVQGTGKKNNAKDKTGVTCYNCGKKGHFKRDCRSKKEWRPVPGKETATIDEVKKGVRFQEVAAASYTQDDLEDDIDRALDLENELTDSDEEGLPLLPANQEDDDAFIMADDQGEIAPPPHIAIVTTNWEFELVQEEDGRWRTRRSPEETPGLNLIFLRNRVEDLRERVFQLQTEKQGLERTLEERNHQYRRLREELDLVREGVRELTNTHESIGRHLDGITREAQAMHEAQEQAWTDHTPWDGPSSDLSEIHMQEVCFPHYAYQEAQEQRRNQGLASQDWESYWSQRQYLSRGKPTSDVETAGLRGVNGRFQLMEGDHPRMNPRRRDHAHLPWFQCVAHECRYHFQTKFQMNHWPVRPQDRRGEPTPTTWVYEHGNAPAVLLWKVDQIPDGRLSFSPKNAWPEGCMSPHHTDYCEEADCLVHADAKLAEHAKWRVQCNRPGSTRAQRLANRQPTEPWLRQWLQEHQTIDAASQGADRDALKYHTSLGNGSGPSEGPEDL